MRSQNYREPSHERFVSEPKNQITPVITSEQLLEHWQGTRRATRKFIEAFPEKELFEFSVGGMRTFSQLALEFIGMAVPTLVGVTNRRVANERQDRGTEDEGGPLRLWDETTDGINELWPKIKPDRFQETDKAFGQWEMTIYGLFFYLIDNEIHHRGQGSVYLRALESSRRSSTRETEL
jgi:uncharacterized damage-inducible protein DinB